MVSKINERDVMRRARRVLADLYTSGASIRRVVYDAGLDAARIDFSGPLVQVWYEVLEEASKHDRVASLLAVAAQEYPSKSELRELASMLGVAQTVPTSPREGYRPRLFLSHHSSDRAVVEALRVELEEVGFEPVTVEGSVSLGEDFKVGALRAVEGSDAAMVFVSAASVASILVSEESRWILRRLSLGRYLAVPARLDETPIPAEFAKFAALDLRAFSGGALPAGITSSLDGLRERLLLGRSAPQVVESAESAVSPLLSYLRRLAAS